MKILLSIIAILVLSGCAQSGYNQFYTPYVDANTLPNVQLLQPNEEPKVISSSNVDQDIKRLRAKMYLPIGYSSFNGAYEDTKNAVAQAKKIGATVVVTNSEFTDTQTSTSALILPDSQQYSSQH